MTAFTMAALLLGLIGTGQGGLAPRAAVQAVGCEYPHDPVTADSSDRAALAHACRAAIASESANPDAYLILMYAVMDDSVALLEVAETALEAVAGNAFVQFNAGLTLRRFGRFDEALAALERAAALEPSEADPLIQAGLIATSIGQLERAVSYLQDASTREPDEPTTWGYLARAEAALGRDADAIRHWDRAQEESGWKYLYRHGDQAAYDSSLAIAPDAHVPPSQLGPTLRALGMLAIPALLALGLAATVLGLGRKRWKAPLSRLFLTIVLVHFIASMTLLGVTIGAAYGAHQGWPGIWLEYPLMVTGQLLVFPIVIARGLLPWEWGIGYGWPWVMLNSLLWAGAITLVVHLWKQRRFPRVGGGQQLRADS